MKASELFCRMWDAPYQHGAKYSGSWAVWNWEEENALIISFQQTVQDKDWVQNFKVWTKAVLNIRKYHTSYIYFDGAEEANVEV